MQSIDIALAELAPTWWRELLHVTWHRVAP